MTDYERRALERAIEDRLALIGFEFSDESGSCEDGVVPTRMFNRIALDDVRDLSAVLDRLRRGEDL